MENNQNDPHVDEDIADVEPAKKKGNPWPLIGFVLIVLGGGFFLVKGVGGKKPVGAASMVASADVGQAPPKGSETMPPPLPPGMRAKIDASKDAPVAATAASTPSAAASAGASASASTSGKATAAQSGKPQQGQGQTQSPPPKKVAFGGTQVFSGDAQQPAPSQPAQQKTREQLVEEKLRTILGTGQASQGLPFDRINATTTSAASVASKLQSPASGEGNEFPVVAMHRIQNPTLTIEARRPIECVLTRQLVLSGLPQPVQCRITRDITGFDGRAVVIEAGSTVNGRSVGAAADGQERFSADWNSIITPSGFRVAFQSGTSDATGAAGIPAEVNNRWGERLFGVFAVSALADFISYKTSQAKQGSTLSVSGSTTGAIQKTGEKVFEKQAARQPIAFIPGGTVLRIETNVDITIGGTHEFTGAGK